ncbi:MAG: ATP-binding cassette domain-containing protein [Phycisphaerae bacterium]|nr:ATP-binding cassette domain-containing protein [Phycisphaerae bacterium]
MVTVENIHHRYGSQLALDGVSFNVSSGECFGLLGPNGSGKSTLFKILTTLLPPTMGRATIAGYDVVNQRELVRGRIGVVFQSPSLDAQLTVRENLMHGGRLYGLMGSSLRSRVDEVMATLGVTERSGSLVKTLSGGLKRRVELAKCLLHEPSLLILDEPCNGLDPRARKELWQHLLAARQSRGTTLLLTTHDMDEADRCDRLAVFDRGRVVVIGEPDELKRRIGGECVTIDSDDADLLARDITEQLRVKAGCVNGVVRVEAPDGAQLMARLLGQFGTRIRSITLGKPTLEDVFIHETGHRFEDATERNGVAK